jgi:hypothetical protein
MTVTINKYEPDDLKLDQAVYRDEVLTHTPSGVAGYILDTTTYPVDDQATKTEKFTVDDGTEQTITFTTAISRGRAKTSNSWPVADQTGLTVLYKVDGGSERTVTFSTCTTQAHALAQLNAQLVGAYALSVSTVIHVLSNTKGASSSIEITGGTATGITWATEDTCNTAEDIAAQINDQIDGASAGVVGGQVKITSDLASAASEVSNGTGTATLSWAADVDGTGVSGTVKRGTLLARNSSTKVLNVYASAGSLSTDEPVAVLVDEHVFTTTASVPIRAQFTGKVAQEILVEHDNASALDVLVLDKLMKNSGIVPVSMRSTAVYDNE